MLALQQGDMARAGDLAYNLGSLHKQCNALDLAQAAFDDALALSRRSGHRSLQGLCHREFALLARWRGDLAEARDEIDTALRLAEESGDRQILADILHEYGNIDKYQGKLVEAREHYGRCLDINEALGSWERVVPTLISLGTLSLELRRPEEARDHLEHALRLARGLGYLARVAEAERELGAAFERLHEHRTAEAFYRRSLATSHVISNQRETARALFRLGNLLVERSRAQEALRYLTAALEHQRVIYDHAEVPLTLRVLGSAYAQVGEHDLALESLSEALRLQREQGDTLRTVWTLYRLAQVQAEKDPASARETIREAIDLGQKVRSGLTVDSLRVGFFEGPRLLYDLYVDLLLQDGDLAAAFATSEEGRARALLDLLSEAQVDPRAGISPGLQREGREIDERIAWLQSSVRDALTNRWGSEREKALREQLEEALEAGWRLESEIRRRSPRYQELKAPAIQTLKQVQASLPPERALLEYWLGAERSYLFVVTRDEARALPLPPPRELQQSVEELRIAVVKRMDAASFAAEAYPLYRELVAPALEIAPGATELMIIPDGALNLLPFEALITAPPAARSGFGDLEYLIHRAAISYAPSATVLAGLNTDTKRRLQRGAGDGPRFVAFADPDNDGPLALICPGSDDPGASAGGGRTLRTGPLPRLRGSRQEAWRIARRYGGAATVFAGSRATEDHVVTNADVAAAEMLHFAVHGVVCEPRPERSGLILALDNDPAEDGLLETREIFELRLSADLVVLSACETGVGKLVRGEGVVGLTRAFFYAGVPSLVVSLWQVPDQSTAELMTALYGRLDQGETKAEALRRAKLHLLTAGGRTAAPFYWAPFVLVGSRG
jgi:CHAT domain-containing protein/Tfp pilus assembly protein PilF